MSRERRRAIKERARRIQQIARDHQKDTTKDYLQYALVVIIILAIIGGAVYVSQMM